MSRTVTYQKTFFESEDLQAFASVFLRALPADVDKIVSTGSSGCSIASAMLAISKRKLQHFYIRKEKERQESHGNSVVGNLDCLYGKVAIVDDFIASGETIRRVISKLESLQGAFNSGDVEIACIIVGYRDGDNSRKVIEELGLEVKIVKPGKRAYSIQSSRIIKEKAENGTKQ